MRLNSALVPTLLLASVALADVSPTVDGWGGASWNDGKTTDWAAGRFKLPKFKGSGMGFYIVVSLGGLTCGGLPVLRAGITVTRPSDDFDRMEYKAWGKWYSETDETVTEAPDSFKLSAGDEVGIALRQYSSSSGVIAIMNLTTQQVWTRFAHGNTIECNWQADVNWFISPIPSIPFPNFGTMAFVMIQVEGYTTPGKVQLTNLGKLGQNVTSVMRSAHFIVIVYVPLPS